MLQKEIKGDDADFERKAAVDGVLITRNLSKFQLQKMPPFIPQIQTMHKNRSTSKLPLLASLELQTSRMENVSFSSVPPISIEERINKKVDRSRPPTGSVLSGGSSSA